MTDTPHIDGWMPIESAPKDGTVILIARAETGDMRCWPFVEAAVWDASGQDYPWATMDGDAEGNTNGRTEDSPTHWMPLPAPPYQPKGEEA